MKYVIKVVEASMLADVISELGDVGRQLKTYRNFPLIASGELPDDIVEKLRADPRIVYVEADDKRLSLQKIPRMVDAGYTATVGSVQATSTTQGTYFGVPPSTFAWHLPYMSRRQPNVNNTETDRTFSTSRSGVGVNIYVIDSGIRYTHFDFLNAAGTASRALPLPGYTDPFGANGSDVDGHGTHVAGLCGGKFSGFARDANLYSARVFGPAGEWAGDIAFIDACDNIITHKQQTRMPGVVNMSLGAGVIEVFDSGTGQYTVYVQFDDAFVQGDNAINDVVRDVVAAGLTVVVAAGNGWDATVRTQFQYKGINASVCLPANVAQCITVGAISANSAITPFSNYGAGVDVFGPGGSVMSANVAADDSLITMSGTSMAAPCVAGICALYLEENPSATPNRVINWIKTTASTTNVLSRTNLTAHTDADPFISGGITNELRYTNGQAVPYSVDRRSADRIIINPYAFGRSAS